MGMCSTSNHVHTGTSGTKIKRTGWRKRTWSSPPFPREHLERISFTALCKYFGRDLARLILRLTFPNNGWNEVNRNVEQLDEWRIRAVGMPANGVLEPLVIGQSITFRLEQAGAFNWVIGAVTQRESWNHEEYLIKGKSHCFVTRSKFSLEGQDFKVAKLPARDLGNSDIVTLSRSEDKLTFSVVGDEVLGEILVDKEKEVVPVIGLSTGGVCEIVSLQS